MKNVRLLKVFQKISKKIKKLFEDI